MTSRPAPPRGLPGLRRAGSVGLALGAVFALGWTAAHLGIPGVGSPPAEVRATSPLQAFAYYGHAIPGTIAMIAGAAQFALLSRWSSKARPARRRLHAWLGRAYVASALLLGMLGLAIADRASGGFASHFGFRLLAVLIVATTAMGWLRIRQGDWPAHAEWMTRSYSLVFAFVTFRFWLVVFPGGLHDPESYTAAGWWTLLSNLAIAEFINGRRRLHGSRRAGEGAPA